MPLLTFFGKLVETLIMHSSTHNSLIPQTWVLSRVGKGVGNEPSIPTESTVTFGLRL